MAIVRPLDDALVETQSRVQGRDVPKDTSRWSAAHSEWENGWVRLTPQLADAELEARYKSVGTILTTLDTEEHSVSTSTEVKVATRAIANARIALSYWIRQEDLPEPSFPSANELLVLLGQGDPEPLAADKPFRQWLDANPQPPWRPEPPAAAPEKRSRWRERAKR
jgi:hypothetical protein